jgi:hypothetical protein
MADPAPLNNPETEPSEVEDEDEHSCSDPGECWDETESYRVQCKVDAHNYLERTRGLTYDEAKKYVKEHVTWNVTTASFEDAGEARTAEVSVDIDFGKEPLSASLNYHHRTRWSSVEYFCKLTWDGSGSNTTILQKNAFKLKAAQLKRAQERCFPEDWAPAEAMEFLFICIGASGPCHYCTSNKGLTTDTEVVCKQMEGKGKKKRAAGGTKGGGAKGGVTKSKAPGQSTAAKRKKKVDENVAPF